MARAGADNDPQDQPQGTTMAPPAFSQPRQRTRLQDPPPAESSSPSSSSPSSPGSPSSPTLSEPSDVSAGSGSSGASEGAPGPASTDVLERRKAKLVAFRSIIGVVLDAAGGLINSRLALFQEDDTWKMTEDDRKNIATPTARLAARHVPLPATPGEANDMADVVEAIAGAASYLIRNLERRREFKREMQQGAELDRADQDAGVPA